MNIEPGNYSRTWSNTRTTTTGVVSVRRGNWKYLTFKRLPFDFYLFSRPFQNHYKQRDRRSGSCYSSIWCALVEINNYIGFILQIYHSYAHSTWANNNGVALITSPYASAAFSVLPCLWLSSMQRVFPCRCFCNSSKRVASVPVEYAQRLVESPAFCPYE